jgi:hypothetical protein
MDATVTRLDRSVDELAAAVQAEGSSRATLAARMSKLVEKHVRRSISVRARLGLTPRPDA